MQVGERETHPLHALGVIGEPAPEVGVEVRVE